MVTPRVFLCDPLLTPEQRAQLLANGKKQREAQEAGRGEDFFPVVKLFTPDAGATWLLTELDPEDQGLAFGLEELRGPLGLGSAP